MSTPITLAGDLARQLVHDDLDGTEPYEAVDHKQIRTTDWESVNALIIRERETGRLYRSTYRDALTEGSAPGPWEDVEEVVFTEVVAVPKVTTVTIYVSPDKVPAPEPEPDPSDPRQIATDLIHEHARDVAFLRARDAVAERFDLKALGVQGYAVMVDEVQQHIIRATVTVEIPDEVASDER